MEQVWDQVLILIRSAEREEAAACLSGMLRDATAEGEAIRKEISRIFQGMGKIVDEH